LPELISAPDRIEVKATAISGSSQIIIEIGNAIL
jgi:hypothetical protein